MQLYPKRKEKKKNKKKKIIARAKENREERIF